MAHGKTKDVHWGECTHYHPRLCHQSVNEGKCEKVKCSYTHLQGTSQKMYTSRQQYNIVPKNSSRMSSDQNVTPKPAEQMSSFLHPERIDQRLEHFQQ